MSTIGTTKKNLSRVGKGRPSGSMSFGFPLPPLKFRTVGFPSTASNGPSMATFDDFPGVKCRPHPPHDSVLYATAVAIPRNT